jgi:hypothetical protein
LGWAAGLRANKVILVSIDGLRYTEAFVDAGRRYVPRLDSLSHYGVLYANFFNNAASWTTPAHDCMLTGVREARPNCDYIEGSGDEYSYMYSVRPYAPTIFEILRAAHRTPGHVWSQDSVRALVGNPNTHVCGYSLDPLFGYDCRATVWPQDFVRRSDTQVADSALFIIRNRHVPFLFVHLADVDHYGHDGVWGPVTLDTSYTGAIRKADSLAAVLWRAVQNHADYYADSTLFIVTSDHGRMSDILGGFKDHGDLSHGCEHVMFLALGPNHDLLCDSIIITSGDVVDLVPTMARVLGADAPLAQGRVLWEMFDRDSTGITPDSSLRQEKVDFYSEGSYLYRVWVQRPSGTARYSGSRPRSVWLARSTNAGASWQDSTRISTRVDSAGSNLYDVEACWPRVVADGSRVYVSWLYRFGAPGAGDPNWEIFIKRSTSYGSPGSWPLEENLVASSALTDTGVGRTGLFAHQPLTLEASGDRAIVMFGQGALSPGARKYYVRSLWVDFVSAGAAAGPVAEEMVQIVNPETGLPIPGPATRAANLSIVVSDRCTSPQGLNSCRVGNTIYLTWYDCRKYPFAPDSIGYWNVFGDRSLNLGASWLRPPGYPNDDLVLSAVGDTLHAYDPAVAASTGGDIAIAWADQRDVPGSPQNRRARWRIVCKTSADGLSVIHDVSDPPDSCLTPDIVATDAHTFVCVWTQVNTSTQPANYDIYWSKSTDGGKNWGTAALLPNPGPGPDYSLSPKIGYAQGKCHVVWQDLRSGRWEIRYLSFTP